MKIKKYDDLLFVVVDKSDKTKVLCKLENKDLADASNLEEAIFTYRQVKMFLLKYGQDNICFRRTPEGVFKITSFASCRTILDDTLQHEWGKTINVVLREKGNITKSDYIQNHWIKDVALNIVHTKL